MNPHETDRPGLPELGDDRVEAMFDTITARIDADARLRTRRRRAVLVAAAAVVVVGGLGVGETLVRSGGSGEGASSMAVDAGAEDGTAAGPRAATDRAVVMTGEASVVVDDPGRAADELTAFVERSGGRVESRSQQDDAEATLRLRVRPAQLDALQARLAELGDVTSLALDEVDVSEPTRDAKARLRSQQAVVRRLQELARTARTTSDLLAVEQALAERQAELEATQAEVDTLVAQAAMATLQVTLLTPDTVDEDDGGFLDGLRAGWDALVPGARTVGLALPWVAAAAGVGAVVQGLRRRGRRS